MKSKLIFAIIRKKWALAMFAENGFIFHNGHFFYPLPTLIYRFAQEYTEDVHCFGIAWLNFTIYFQLNRPKPEFYGTGDVNNLPNDVKR